MLQIREEADAAWGQGCTSFGGGAKLQFGGGAGETATGVMFEAQKRDKEELHFMACMSYPPGGKGSRFSLGSLWRCFVRTATRSQRHTRIRRH